MSASKKHATPNPAGQAHPAQQSTASSDLPSSSGDSPKRVTPKDITPEHASWADLKVTDVGANRANRAGRDEQAAASAHRGVGGSDTEADTGSRDLPSSHGDSPQEVTPKDITPEHAAWNDVITRQVAPAGTLRSDAERRQESLIDETVELSFPASDPPAELPQSARCPEGMDCESEEEAQLDDAIELTFPASDPIAVSQITKIEVDKAPDRH